MNDWPPQSTTLTGTTAVLEPLEPEHVHALQEAVSDGRLWELNAAFVPTREAMPLFVEQALVEQQHGRSLPFVVRDASTRRVVGTTRYRNIDAHRRRLEIGFTWYAQSVQRTSLNTDCKLLLLAHAFDSLRCVAVEWRVHALNFRSREAVLKLGAKQDGILRNLVAMADGQLADIVVFSVIDSEWPRIRGHLQARAKRLSGLLVPPKVPSS
jgi:N-acetyltransferase